MNPFRRTDTSSHRPGDSTRIMPLPPELRRPSPGQQSPPSRENEHASREPRAIDSGFCYDDEGQA